MPHGNATGVPKAFSGLSQDLEQAANCGEKKEICQMVVQERLAQKGSDGSLRKPRGVSRSFFAISRFSQQPEPSLFESASGEL
jgi:hypothetical protein